MQSTHGARPARAGSTTPPGRRWRRCDSHDASARSVHTSARLTISASRASCSGPTATSCTATHRCRCD